MSKNYTDVIAELYDYCPFFSKYRVDSNYALLFYLPILEEYQIESVLELGSATGNLTIPIARKGISVDSVDISKDMHAIIKNKLAKDIMLLENKINLITDDIFSVRLNRKYDMVAMPDNFLSAMRTYEEQCKLIELAGKALKPNGILVFDVSPPNDFLIDGLRHNFVTRTRTPSKDVYIIKCDITIDAKEHLNYQKFDISKVDKKMKIIGHWNTQIVYRYLFKNEIIRILREQGFEIIEIRDEIVKNVKEYAFVARYVGMGEEIFYKEI